MLGTVVRLMAYDHSCLERDCRLRKGAVGTRLDQAGTPSPLGDVVIITGTAIVNGTMDHLLELARERQEK